MNVIFIGGTPRSGKTTIAKELSKKLGIPWISTDTLESVVMEYVEDNKFDSYFPKNVLRRLTNNSNDEMCAKYTSEQIVDAYFEQGKSLTQGIEVFITSEASYRHSYILEGHHIHPELVLKLEKNFGLKVIFVGREDIVQTLEAITKNPQKNDWVITKTKDTNTYPLIAKMLTAFSTRIRGEAGENKYPYFSMDGNFEETVQGIVDEILNCINYGKNHEQRN